RLELLHEAEGASGRDLPFVAGFAGNVFADLLADQGMGEENAIGDKETVGGIDGHTLAAVHHLHGLQDLDVFAASALPLQARLPNQPHKGQGTAVYDRQFEVVDLDESVVHLERRQCREQVLSGRDEHALPHQSSSVADASDVANARLDGETFEVGPLENDTGVGWSRCQAEAYFHSSMDANAGHGG